MKELDPLELVHNRVAAGTFVAALADPSIVPLDSSLGFQWHIATASYSSASTSSIASKPTSKQTVLVAISQVPY